MRRFEPVKEFADLLPAVMLREPPAPSSRPLLRARRNNPSALLQEDGVGEIDIEAARSPIRARPERPSASGCFNSDEVGSYSMLPWSDLLERVRSKASPFRSAPVSINRFDCLSQSGLGVGLRPMPLGLLLLFRRLFFHVFFELLVYFPGALVYFVFQLFLFFPRCFYRFDWGLHRSRVFRIVSCHGNLPTGVVTCTLMLLTFEVSAKALSQLRSVS